jgi:hypothetical protein
MILYGVTLLPLIKKLKRMFKELFQPWYADDSTAAGPLQQVKDYLIQLKKLGEPYGYYVRPDKSVLVTPSASLSTAHAVFHHLPLKKITTGYRFLGGFIGEQSAFTPWLESKINMWEDHIQELSAACTLYPQTAYSALQKSLQMTWQFLQRVAKCPEQAFAPLEKAIADGFLPLLFGGPTPDRSLSCLPVKFGGLALPDPTVTATSNYKASTLVTASIISSLVDKATFSLPNHQKTVATARSHISSLCCSEHTASFDQIKEKAAPSEARRIERSTETGAWLTTSPLTSIGTAVSADTFRVNLCIRYGIDPPHLPAKCDACGSPFTTCHAMQCQPGGLIILRHNDLRDEIAEIACDAFSPSSIRSEPRIFPHNSHSAERGDLLVHGLFERGIDSIIDFRVVNLDAPSYVNKPSHDVILTAEKDKKRQYLQPCLDQQRQFFPFVVSTDGVLGAEAKAILKQLATKLAHKWSRPYSSVRNYLNTRVSLACVRATHLCVRGSRILTKTMSSRKYLWDDGEGAYFIYQNY